MKSLNCNNAEFVLSAASKKQFIRSSVPGIVFAGKSNVGKSSMINMLLGRKNFAKVGGTPGKTVHVNYFLIDRRMYFIDLPGYGFANVPKAERDRWGELMEDFFAEPDLFRLGILIVDARHKPTADDVNMFRWFKASGKKFVVAANKADKLKNAEIEPHMAEIRETLGFDGSEILIPFSAEKGTGKQELLRMITES